MPALAADSCTTTATGTTTTTNNNNNHDRQPSPHLLTFCSQRLYTALYLQWENMRLLTVPAVLSCDYSFDAIPFVKTLNDPRMATRVLPLFVAPLVQPF